MPEEALLASHDLVRDPLNRTLPLVDGFGMIALASLTPMIFVMVLGVLRFGPRIPGAG